MQSPRDFDDVVIVGGGPSGLAAAAELAYHGRRSIVIEPRAAVNDARPRAKTTSARTMEHFRRWGIADDVRAAAALPATWCDRAVFCDTVTGSVITEFSDIFGLNAAEQGIAAESGQQIGQPAVERVLRAHLRASGLVDLRLGETVEDIVEQADHVDVAVRSEDGTVYALSSRFVLGCDGARSLVRERIGGALEGASAPHPNLNVVFRASPLRPPMGEALHYWVLGVEPRGVVGPLDREGLWWASLGGSGGETGAGEVARLVRGLLGEAASDVPIEILSMDPWTPRMLLSTRYATDRIFLVGESAHVNPPLGGHGFNTSVGDAVNVGWKLAAVLEGWADPSLLASYEAERRAVAASTIASAARNLAATGPDLPLDAAAIQSAKLEEFHSLGLVLGYSYDGSETVDVVRYRPSMRVGARLPHRWLEPGHSLYDDLGPWATLIHPSSAARADLDRAVERFAAAGVPLTVLQDDIRSPDDGESHYLLIRPDQHIAWSGDDPDHADPALLTSSTKRAS